METVRRIDVKEHVIEVQFSLSDEAVLYDGKKMSTGKLENLTETHYLFAVRESGKRVFYEVILVKEQDMFTGSIHMGASHNLVLDALTILGNVARSERALRTALRPEIKKLTEVAVIRDYKVVHNRGVLILAKHMENLKKDLVLKGIDISVKIGHCRQCKQNVTIPDSRFCPNCGSLLEAGPLDASPSKRQRASSRTDGKAMKRKSTRTCIVCEEVFERGDLVAWCPYCGDPAHRIHLVKWLHDKGSCPSCGMKLSEKELNEALQ